jgi:hypothetical protein
MKKIILSLVGIVSMTAGSWALSLNSATFVGDNGLSYDLGGDGWTWDSNYGLMRTTPSGVQQCLAFYQPGNIIVYVSDYSDGKDDYCTVDGRVLVGNPSNLNEAYSDGNVTVTNFFPAETAAYLRTLGYLVEDPIIASTPTPEPEVTGEGDATVSQAEQLNFGLGFNNGQWTPTQ